MNAHLLFAVGTLALWIGLFFAFRAAWLGIRLLLNEPGLDRTRTQGALWGSALAGAIGLLVPLALPLNTGRPSPGLSLPIVWFVLPLAGWVAVLAVIGFGLRIMQSLLAITEQERGERLKAAGFWAVAIGVFLYLASLSKDPVEILRGSIPLSPTTALVLVLLIVAAMFAMVYAGRATATRGLSKRVVVQTMLLAGSVVFGLPFVWLLITSFKEDRDMASPTGIVWIPRIQKTVPYMDPDDPLIEARFQGQTVQGTILQRYEDGSVQLDILRPGVMRGMTFVAEPPLKEVPKDIPLVTGQHQGQPIEGKVIKENDDGSRVVSILEPESLKGTVYTAKSAEVEPVRVVGLRWQNYTEALEFLPPETAKGLVYLRNTLILVAMNVIGTLLSSALVAYAFARMRFPGKNWLFVILLSTMMLPAAVTLLPTFLIFRQLGWIDTLLPLWVPAFLGSAFNIFLLRQFFMTIPMELEDAAKIDGCTYLRTFWQVMLPQIKPALAVVAIWTFMGAWNNFMGPLVYINSPENMPLSYALQLFQSDRGTEAGLMMAFATLAMLPVLAVFFFAQKYFIEGVALTGLGGR